MTSSPDTPAPVRLLARWAPLLALLAALSGCASRFNAQITSFQQWPLALNTESAAPSYRLTALPASNAHDNPLETVAYQNLLREAIATIGLVEAQDASPARFDVALDYRVEATRIVRREPVEPVFHGVWGRPWGWGGYYAPLWMPVEQNASRIILTVTFYDNHQNRAEVYRASAVTLAAPHNQLPQAVPHLLRAIFADFPGANGQVRSVSYQTDAPQ